MKYISLDIETTGLDPYQDQILEIGMVTWEGSTFHCYVDHSRLTGHVRALAMHSRILGRLASREAGFQYVAPTHVARSMIDWLNQWFGPGERITVAGKNVWFDMAFLKLLPDWPHERFDHRYLDPGSMYVRAEDTVVPGLKECCARAGMGDITVPHDAVGDAHLVRELVDRFLCGG